MVKLKEKILNTAREKQQITHRGIPIRIIADLSKDTLQIRREWQNILKVIKEKKPTNQITIPSKDIIQI